MQNIEPDWEGITSYVWEGLISGDDPCTYCGMDLCECYRLAADQNDDYESLVY